MLVIFPSKDTRYLDYLHRIDHAEKLHELPDEYLADALPLAKKVALAIGAENYNILQVRFAVPLFICPEKI